MGDYQLSKGRGRTRLELLAREMGGDLVVFIFNQQAHVGAVAVAEFDKERQRASVSVITRLGHKDDVVAQKAAHLICKSTQRPVCVVAGIHLDNITPKEIESCLANTGLVIRDFIDLVKSAGV